MEYLNDFLPIIIYILLIILIILLIVIAVKFINAMNKVQKIAEDVDDKIQSLNGFFQVIDGITDKIVVLSDRAIDKIIYFINKIFKKNEKKVEEDKDE